MVMKTSGQNLRIDGKLFALLLATRSPSTQLPYSELQYLVSQSALVESDWSVTQNVLAA